MVSSLLQEEYGSSSTLSRKCVNEYFWSSFGIFQNMYVLRKKVMNQVFFYLYINVLHYFAPQLLFSQNDAQLIALDRFE